MSSLTVRYATAEDDSDIAIAELEEDCVEERGMPDWVQCARNLAALPRIIEATKCSNEQEADYAFHEMLKILERVEEESDIYSMPMDTVVSAYDVIIEFIQPNQCNHNPRRCQYLQEPLPYLIELAQKVDELQTHGKELLLFLVSLLDLEAPLTLRRHAIYAVGMLLERKQLSQDALRTLIIPRLLDLAELPREWTDKADQLVEVISVLCRVITCHAVLDRKWIFLNLLPRYSHFLNNPVIHVRKAAVQIFGHLAAVYGESFTESFLVPRLLVLCADANWGVRKTATEVFVEVAKYSPSRIRTSVLAPRFIRLLNDSSRWVYYVAYQEIGPFIATFADSTVTGLSIKHGRVHEEDRDKLLERRECDMLWDLAGGMTEENESFGTLPPGCWTPSQPPLYDQSNDSERVLSAYLEEWSSQKCLSASQSAPSSVIEGEEGDASGPAGGAAAKCSSYEDLSNIGMDSRPEETSFDEDCVDLDETIVELSDVEQPREEILNNQTQNQSDQKQLNTVDVDEKCAETSRSPPKEESFISLNYWAPPYDAFGIEDEELVAWGTSSPSSTAEKTKYLERRLDVLYVSPEKKPLTPNRSPLASPKGIGSASEATPSTSDAFPEEWKSTGGGIRSAHVSESQSDMVTMCSSDEEENAGVEENGCKEQNIVPQELVDQFMSGACPDGSSDADISRHCAHNFPAVAFTLGRSNWTQLKDTYRRLANDEQVRVRLSIANSMHEMAAIVGTEHTDHDLFPIFHSLREDISEVRVGVLKHLFEFYKCLSMEKRRCLIAILPQFMSLDDATGTHSNWRFRLELAKQCRKLCDICEVDEMNRTMSAIALTLANDRVFDVRREAVRLVAQIMGRLVRHEWRSISTAPESDEKERSLSEVFVEDLVKGFARSQKWARRQTFALVCDRILAGKLLTPLQFRFFLLPNLTAMATDRVANVRMSVCGALARLPGALQPLPMGNETTPRVSHVMEKLMQDVDCDVARSARKARGWDVGKEKVELTRRGERVRCREEEMMRDKMRLKHLDLVQKQLVDNFESSDMDVSVSPQKPAETSDA